MLSRRIYIKLLIALISLLSDVNSEKIVYKYNPEDIPVKIHSEFINWKNKNKKNYETAKEYLFRLQNFYENYIRMIELKVGYGTISYEGEEDEETSTLRYLGNNARKENTLNQLTIEKLNRKGNWQADLGKFADLTKAEFLKYWTGYMYNRESDNLKLEDTEEHVIKSEANNILHKNKKVSADETWDWRKEGGITEVRNQKRCGASYAIAVVSAIENAYC